MATLIVKPKILIYKVINIWIILLFMRKVTVLDKDWKLQMFFQKNLLQYYHNIDSINYAIDLKMIFY